MIDYWLTQWLLSIVGWAYLGAVIIAAAAAIMLPSNKNTKIVMLLVVLGLASILPMREYVQHREEQAFIEAFKARQAKASALFAQRCKTAGERFASIPEVASGVLLARLRPPRNLSDQHALNDPYGSDYAGEAFARSMLWGRRDDGFLDNTSLTGARFSYVVYRIEGDSRLYRMSASGARKRNGELEFTVALTDEVPKYTVTFEDISAKIDREYWIAGSKLQVVESRTGSVVAERIGWMMDPEQGNKGGERSPWGFAAYNACPPFPKLHGRYPIQNGQTRNFVEKAFSKVGEQR